MSFSRWRISRFTLIVCLLIAGPVVIHALLQLLQVGPLMSAKQWMLFVATRLSFAAVLTLVVALPVEWLCRGGRFSLLAMMVGVLVAGFLMWLNLTPPGEPGTPGWPFIVSHSEWSGMAFVGDVVVCLATVLFSSAVFEWALRELERIRQNPPWSSSPGGPAWRSFSQNCKEQRKRDREAKATQDPGPE